MSRHCAAWCLHPHKHATLVTSCRQHGVTTHENKIWIPTSAETQIRSVSVGILLPPAAKKYPLPAFCFPRGQQTRPRSTSWGLCAPQGMYLLRLTSLVTTSHVQQSYLDFSRPCCYYELRIYEHLV